jgi:DNA polymerase-3 subunit alpha (Gram-positive type)
MDYFGICDFLNGELRKSNIEDQKVLCNDIYRYDETKHPEWKDFYDVIDTKYKLINDITETLTYPVNHFLRIITFVYRPGFPVSTKTTIDNKVYDDILNRSDISDKDKYIIMAAKMSRHFYDAEYYEAEELAELLSTKDNLPVEVVINLIEYYKNTRRYDCCESLYEKYKDDALNYEYDDALERQSGKKKEYRPSKKERIEVFIDFMNDCLDIDIGSKPSERGSHNDRMNDCDYPEFEFVTNMDFDSFVAYDVETSGFSSRMDYITEIGAIKVVNGKVVDSEQFRFQELIHPYGKPKDLPKAVVDLTGITQDMVDNARSVTEVFNDFADFIGDNILVGYNNKAFDGKFLRRAGRYAHRIITNKQFDVLPITYLYCDTDDNKLGTVAASYGIENPRAHRAYADAITTARLYLKLKELKEE